MAKIISLKLCPSTCNCHFSTHTADSDYTAIITTITFSAGTTAFSFPVDTSDDDSLEQLERFTALLSNPSQNIAIGSQDTAEINLMDNEGIIIICMLPITLCGIRSWHVSLIIVYADEQWSLSIMERRVDSRMCKSTKIKGVK
jgi:hypothetical protein